MSYRSKSQTPRCERCRQHEDRCICAELPSLSLETKLVLVMHCREVPKTTATGPLALACLTNSELFVHGERDVRLDLNHLFEEGRRVLLLYPSEEARPIEDVRAESGAPITLIVPDGSWRQAGRAAKRIPGLERAERVTLPRGKPTEWGLRKETKEGGLATFEAIARAFGPLEGASVEAQLTEAFRLAVSETWATRGGPLSGPNGDTAGRGFEDPEVDILFEDETLVVVNKPAGALVHRGWANDGVPLLQAVRDRVGQFVYPVHRLDRGTSGALLFAKSSEMARELQQAFHEHKVEKAYLALCRGNDPALTRVDHPLTTPSGDAKKAAVTEFRWLGSQGRYGLYEARPLTGRLHQIRRHLKYASHPIIGDVRYGKGDHNRIFREEYRFHRLALHCHRLAFAHPRTGVALTINAPLPPDFARVLSELSLAVG